MTRKFLLSCGILSSLMYVFMDVVSGLRYDGYSFAAHTVSELSATGTATRPLMLVLGAGYQVLITLFAIGVFASAGKKRDLRIAGALLIAYGLIGFTAPFFSMQKREVIATAGPILTDRLHIVATAIAVLLMFTAIAFASKTHGRGFRLYSITTILVSFAFGMLTSRAAPDMEAGLPTPWIGITERICIGVFLLWIVVFAVLLLQRTDERRAAASRTALAA